MLGVSGAKQVHNKHHWCNSKILIYRYNKTHPLTRHNKTHLHMYVLYHQDLIICIHVYGYPTLIYSTPAEIRSVRLWCMSPYDVYMLSFTTALTRTCGFLASAIYVGLCCIVNLFGTMSKKLVFVHMQDLIVCTFQQALISRLNESNGFLKLAKSVRLGSKV